MIKKIVLLSFCHLNFAQDNSIKGTILGDNSEALMDHQCIGLTPK